MGLWTAADWHTRYDPLSAVQIDTRLSNARSLREDRAYEIAEYKGCSLSEVEDIYRQYHERRAIRLKPVDDTSPAALLSSYTDRDWLGWLITRFMLHYTRLDQALQLLLCMRSLRREGRPLRVIDYGCGAADFGVLFALNGADVTLVDVEDGILNFAAWRFQRRSLSVRTVAVSAAELYPELPKADLVIAGDVLEHVMDPPRSIEHIHQALDVGGYFWFPDYPCVPREVGGMHIQRAADLREAAKRRLDALFDAIDGPTYLRRIKPSTVASPREPRASMATIT